MEKTWWGYSSMVLNLAIRGGWRRSQRTSTSWMGFHDCWRWACFYGNNSSLGERSTTWPHSGMVDRSCRKNCWRSFHWDHSTERCLSRGGHDQQARPEGQTPVRESAHPWRDPSSQASEKRPHHPQRWEQTGDINVPTVPWSWSLAR